MHTSLRYGRNPRETIAAPEASNRGSPHAGPECSGLRVGASVFFAGPAGSVISSDTELHTINSSGSLDSHVCHAEATDARQTSPAPSARSRAPIMVACTFGMLPFRLPCANCRPLCCPVPPNSRCNPLLFSTLNPARRIARRGRDGGSGSMMSIPNLPDCGADRHLIDL